MTVLMRLIRAVGFSVYVVGLLLGAIVAFFLLRDAGINSLWQWAAAGAIIFVGGALYVLFPRS